MFSFLVIVFLLCLSVHPTVILCIDRFELLDCFTKKAIYNKIFLGRFPCNLWLFFRLSMLINCLLFDIGNLENLKNHSENINLYDIRNILFIENFLVLKNNKIYG